MHVVQGGGAAHLLPLCTKKKKGFLPNVTCFFFSTCTLVDRTDRPAHDGTSTRIALGTFAATPTIAALTRQQGQSGKHVQRRGLYRASPEGVDRKAWIDFVFKVMQNDITEDKRVASAAISNMDGTKTPQEVMQEQVRGNSKPEPQEKQSSYDHNLEQFYLTDKITETMNLGVESIITHATMYSKKEDVESDARIRGSGHRMNDNVAKYQAAIKTYLKENKSFRNDVCLGVILRFEELHKGPLLTKAQAKKIRKAHRVEKTVDADYLKTYLRLWLGSHDEFLCPISGQLIQDPVVASDGFTGEGRDRRVPAQECRPHAKDPGVPLTKTLHLNSFYTHIMGKLQTVAGEERELLGERSSEVGVSKAIEQLPAAGRDGVPVRVDAEGRPGEARACRR